MLNKNMDKKSRLLPHEVVPIVSYMFYDEKTFKMGKVTEITYSENGVPTHIIYKYNENNSEVKVFREAKDGKLIPSTGLWTQDSKEIYAGDLVVCRYMEKKDQIRYVFWDNGWRVLGSTAEEFKQAVNDMVYVIGSRFVNNKAYQKYLEHINI